MLYIGAHARRVIGMALPAGRILLRDLQEHATQPEFVYRHAWQPGDLVLWDNRSVMHRGCRYDLTQVRDMRRTTVLDLPRSTSAIAARTWRRPDHASRGSATTSAVCRAATTR